VKALIDGGSQINVVNSKTIESLGLVPVGAIQIRGIVGEPVLANLVKLQIRIAEDNAERHTSLSNLSSSLRSGADDYATIICAACDGLNEELIITLPVADQLDKLAAPVCFDHNDDSAQSLNEPVAIDSLDNLSGSSVCEHSDAIVSVVTRSQAKLQSSTVHNNASSTVDQSLDVAGSVNDQSDVLDVDDVTALQEGSGQGNREALAKEQLEDESLVEAFNFARRQKDNYLIKDGLLYRREFHCGRELINLVVPRSRRLEVLKLAHDTCHFAGKRTYERIILSGLTWGPSKLGGTVRSDSIDYAAKCPTCQLHARTTCFDRVPIQAVPRDAVVFRHFYMDVFGPICPNEKLRYNFALVIICSASRYPFVYPLSVVNTKSICEALLKMFEVTGIASEMVLTSDNASYFRSALMTEFTKRLGITPRFSTPYHSEGHALVERSVQTMQRLIVKLAGEHRNGWTSFLGPALWAVREVPNATTGLPPHLLAFGQLRSGPLAILRETWTGERDLPVKLPVGAAGYLTDLREKLVAAGEYAEQHTKAEQSRYVRTYNKTARDKHFSVGERCLILQKDDTGNSMFAKWKGPAEIVAVQSPYSYIVEYNGNRYALHANKLRKFRVHVDSAECNAALYASPETMSEVGGSYNCSVVYEDDVDFGDLSVIETVSHISTGKPLLPSQRIDSEKMSHLSPQQQTELFSVLDKYPEVFSEIPGLCTLVEHCIPMRDDFVPRGFKAYRVPEQYRAEVRTQIAELLRLGFIEPSVSPQVSPLVCVLKPKDENGHRAVRMVIDYRYVNRFSRPFVTPLEDPLDIIQAIGNSRFISKFDANSGYHQCPVKVEDRWLTAFVFESNVYQYCRVPYGMVGSGDTFVRAVRQVLQPIRDISKSYVDDMAVHSDFWADHLHDIDRFLTAIKRSGFTLGLRKCDFARPYIKYIGHLIGSGKRGVDPEKVYDAMEKLKEPETKKQLRQIIGFFSFFRDYIPNFASVAKPLTDLTGKRIPERIPFREQEKKALSELKELLRNSVHNPLSIIDPNKAFSIYVDASDYAVGSCLVQSREGKEAPVAFASCKLTPTQQRWATIEKEAYAALWSLNRFKHWIFGRTVTLHSDHNPITFLTEAVPKSSKLMRWALAVQEFNVTFRYRAGSQNTVADCLSRNVYSPGEDGN
jgi:transposase InsO family protein